MAISHVTRLSDIRFTKKAQYMDFAESEKFLV